MFLPGDRIARPGILFQHEGVFLGALPHLGAGDWVAHNTLGRRVSVVPFERFAKRRPRRVALIERPSSSEAPQIVDRALRLVGRRSYDLLTYNCQDFTSDALHGEPNSYDRRAVLIGVGLGLLVLVLGGYVVWRARRKRKKARRGRS